MFLGDPCNSGYSVTDQLYCQKGTKVCLNLYKIFFEVKLIDLLNVALFCQ